MSRENPLSEDAPIFVSTAKRRQFGYDAKRSDRPYKEAKRYLRGRVGDKWNDVWADICSKFAPQDKKEVFDLIKEELSKSWSSLVYLNCFEHMGAIYTNTAYYSEYRVDKQTHYYKRSGITLYVFDGILRETILERVTRPKEQKVVQFNKQEFAQKDGVWYRVILKPISYNRFAAGYGCYDTLRKRGFSSGDGYRFYGREVYCSAHYPLKNKELKALKDYLRETVQ
jgi:hypothetical protein